MNKEVRKAKSIIPRQTWLEAKAAAALVDMSIGQWLTELIKWAIARSWKPGP